MPQDMPRVRWEAYLIKRDDAESGCAISNAQQLRAFSISTTTIFLFSQLSYVPIQPLHRMAETSNLGAQMDIDEAAIDEGLYSRQL